MARPIKDTPIIWGEDARRFTEAMENIVPMPEEEREAIKKAYEWFKSRAKFPL
jgi:heme oxygenase